MLELIYAMDSQDQSYNRDWKPDFRIFWQSFFAFLAEMKFPSQEISHQRPTLPIVYKFIYIRTGECGRVAFRILSASAGF